MYEGFQMQQEYKEMLHLETLRLLRMGAYTSYLSIQKKRGVKNCNIQEFYPLPNDKKVSVDYTDDFIKEFFDRKEPFIENGKLRGYTLGKELTNKEGKLIGYINENNKIDYIN